MTKQCSRCKVEKPYSEFNKKHDTRDGYASRCRLCSRDIQWFIKYGVTPEQYSSLLEAQNGTCAICCQPEPRYKHLSVDHDHSTGEVRGLLCSSCNVLLGYAKDDPEILTSAIQYLKKG